jgi:hypothetical protein
MTNEEAIKLLQEADKSFWSVDEDKALTHAIEVLRADKWHDIETVPAASKVILYSPHRCISNPERVEVDYGDNGAGSYHSWATHWRPLPKPPQKGE